jgi:hypothetical protein
MRRRSRRYARKRFTFKIADVVEHVGVRYRSSIQFVMKPIQVQSPAGQIDGFVPVRTILRLG